MLTLDVPSELREIFRYEAGQHLIVVVDHDGTELRRTYSICASANEQAIRIAVRRVSGGIFSTFAADRLRPGDRLRVMPPTGRFRVYPDANRQVHYAAVAAGSGITPLLSIIATVLESEPQSSVTLLYQNRTRDSTMFLTQLQDLASKHSGRLAIRFFWSREAAATGATSRIGPEDVTQVVHRSRQLDQLTEWYICGPSRLTEMICDTLSSEQINEERIHHELFAHDDNNSDSKDQVPLINSTVHIRAGGVSTELQLRGSGETILAAALREKLDIPYSCTEGLCASCRAKLIVGQVTMRHTSALEKRELQDGYILACQAHPTTDFVEVDFDA